MLDTIILKTDSYKHSHFLQDPPGTLTKYYYAAPRAGSDFDEIVFVGLQPILHMLAKQVTETDVLRAGRIVQAHGLPFNSKGWMQIVNECNGYLPVKIRAIPEGTVIPPGVAPFFIENTGGADFKWLPGLLETVLMRVWYPSTVATLSREIKKIIKNGLEISGDVTGLPFKLHDFGSRGASSAESAGLGGFGHLCNFMGTDTMDALVVAAEYYACDMAGFSIPAAEHSTITAWGRAGEVDAYENMIKQFAKPGSIVAIVADSYDLQNAVDKIFGGELKQQIIDSGATVVIRPDSGDPIDNVLYCLESLGNSFGLTVNIKGFKVLNNVRLIQGDGVNLQSIRQIINHMMFRGWSIDNIAFGMGGALLQKVDRDTCRWAIKCSALEMEDGITRNVQKMPKTDPSKASMAGILGTFFDPQLNKFSTGDLRDPTFVESVFRAERLDRVVFMDGQILQKETLENIRQRAAV